MKMNSVAKGPLLAFWLLIIALIPGCATTPPVDWDSRVGHYTYAQAINDLGPPNRQAHLSSGATELKWYVPAVGTIGAPNNNINNGYNGYNGFGVGPNPHPGNFSDRFLQLTFDGNGVLTNWSKNY